MSYEFYYRRQKQQPSYESDPPVADSEYDDNSGSFDSLEESPICDDSFLTDVARIQRQQIAEIPFMIPCVCMYIGPDNRTPTTSTDNHEQSNSQTLPLHTEPNEQQKQQDTEAEKEIDNNGAEVQSTSVSFTKTTSPEETHMSQMLQSLSIELADITSVSYQFKKERVSRICSPLIDAQPITTQSYGPGNIYNEELRNECSKNNDQERFDENASHRTLKIISTSVNLPSIFIDLDFISSLTTSTISSNESLAEEDIDSPNNEPAWAIPNGTVAYTEEFTFDELSTSILPVYNQDTGIFSNGVFTINGAPLLEEPVSEDEVALTEVTPQETTNDDPIEEYNAWSWIAYSMKNKQKLINSAPKLQEDKEVAWDNRFATHTSGDTTRLSPKMHNKGEMGTIVGENEHFWDTEPVGMHAQNEWNNNCYNRWWLQEFHSEDEDFVPENAHFEPEEEGNEPSFWARFRGEESDEDEQIDTSPRTTTESDAVFWKGFMKGNMYGNDIAN